MKKVIVVTVNYNTENDTKKLLNSLQNIKKTNLVVQVVVIDNGSTKPFTTQLTEAVTVIHLEENTGFTGGYNKGIQFALDNNADYILIVNNDTIVHQNMVYELVNGLERDKKIGAVVPKIYFAKGHEFHKEKYTKEELGKVFWYAGGNIDWNHARSIHRGVDEVDNGQYDTEESVTFATGCCIMFSKEAIEKSGLFDDKYFLYYEDADISVRLVQSGYKIHYIPQAVLFHMNASSSGGAGRGNVLQDYFITRNQMLFGMKYVPLRTKFALIRQSFRLLFSGREKQKQGIRDYYFKKFGKGTFFQKN